MNIGRSALSATLAFSLVACGGGGGGSNNGGSGPISGPTPAPTPTPSACSVTAQQNFARDVLDEWYLFPDLIDQSVRASSFTDVQSYLDALVAPARAQDKDRGFTFVTSIQEEEELIRTGSSAGFGIRLSYDTQADRVFVLEAFENAPAFSQGFDRGVELISIGQSASSLETISSIMRTEGPRGVSERLGSSEPGVRRVFVIEQQDGTRSQVAVSKAEFSLDPISDRYGARIIDNEGTKVGYLNLRTFIVGTADRELVRVFQDFRDEGVTEVILDFRYNGGGLVRIADLIGDLMRGNNTGRVFSRTVLRPSKSNRNDTRLFEDSTRFLNAQTGELGGAQAIPKINPMKIAVISGGGTASASELVANAFLPYVGDNMALIGENSFGKPVGQFGFDLDDCDLRVRAVTFKTENADGQGEYFSGLASVFDNTCRAEDDISSQLGDPNEASTAQALSFLRNGTNSCTPIAATVGVQGTRSLRPRRELLQPDRPSAVQREVPGLY
ncbi:MAG: S41 family peptidase [Pontixanthobacter sp.]